MEALQINVVVSLEEATIQRVAQVFTAAIGGGMARPALPPKPQAEAPKAAAAPAAQPAPAPAQETIDNMTLNQEVKGAQARGVAADDIRAIFTKYGIKSSRECPTDKRPALLAELKAL